MRRINLSAAAVALFLALALPAGLSAQGVTCKDGTTGSASGRGACSHHGGVASVAITVSCRDGSTATPGRGACSHHGGVASRTATPAPAPTSSEERASSSGSAQAPAPEPEPQTRPSAEVQPVPGAPGDATALCNDGTYSHSAHRSGACSHHRGVRQWLKELPSGRS